MLLGSSDAWQGCPDDLDLVEALLGLHGCAGSDDDLPSHHAHDHHQQQPRADGGPLPSCGAAPAPGATAARPQHSPPGRPAQPQGSADGTALTASWQQQQQQQLASLEPPQLLPAAPQLSAERKPSKLFAAESSDGSPRRQGSGACPLLPRPLPLSRLAALLPPAAAGGDRVRAGHPHLQQQHRPAGEGLRSLSNVSCRGTLLPATASDQGDQGPAVRRQWSERAARAPTLAGDAGPGGVGEEVLLEDGGRGAEEEGRGGADQGGELVARTHSMPASPFVRLGRRSAPRLLPSGGREAAATGEAGGGEGRAEAARRLVAGLEATASACEELLLVQGSGGLPTHPRVQALQQQRSLLGRTSSTGGTKRAR